MQKRMTRLARSALCFGLCLTACGGRGFVRMPERPVVWEDDDRAPFSPRPPVRYVSWRGDAVDHLILRPASEVWTLPVDVEAVNVNAWDEVPDSSWFHNRMGRHQLDPRDVARAACDEVQPAVPTPWRVVGGKPDGSHPGLTIEDADGVRYLLKTDGELQPERASAADAIGAALYWAAGYSTPCNRVHSVRREDLQLDPEARVEMTSGAERALTDTDVEIVLRSAGQADDGRFRVGLSRFFEHEPIGPWDYAGVLEADPNDAVPHELRRELRGGYLLAAWTGHIDVRQENTLAVWHEVGDGVGFVEHRYVDFGDCFGVTIGNERMSRRFEHDHYLNLGNVLVDAVTLGAIDRPWQHGRGGVGETLGFFDAERFRPDEWAPGYPNPAFDARTEHDDAWMARILARFSPAHVQAAVSVGQLSPPARRALVETLLERRRRILERYLTRLSPLAWPRSEAGRVCFEDMMVTAGLRAAEDRQYAARLVASDPPRAPTPLEVGPGPCVTLPEGVGYLAIDVRTRTPGRDAPLPLRAHLYRGAVHGLERLRDDGAPW